MLVHANVYQNVRRPSNTIYSSANQICCPNYLWFYYIVSADAWAKLYLKAMLLYSIEFCVVVIRAENTTNRRCLLFGCLCYYYFLIYSNWIDCAKHLRNWCIPTGAVKIVTTFCRCRPRSCWNQISVRIRGFEFEGIPTNIHEEWEAKVTNKTEQF